MVLYTNYKLIKQIINQITNKKETKILITKQRNWKILPININKTISVYNGIKYINIKITTKMLNNTIGSFTLTRHRFKYTKKTNTNK
jgi:ribosomal protein S19